MLSKKSYSIRLLLYSYLASVVAANCSNFTPGAGVTDYYKAFFFPQQTSGAITCDNATYNGMLCPNGGGCSLPSDGAINLIGQLNTTTPIHDPEAESLYTTVSNAMGQYGRAPILYKDGCYKYNNEVAICIPNNVSAYATLAPQGACVNGTFSGCTGDSQVSDGTAVSVCGYIASEKGNAQADSVTIPASAVPQYGTPPLTTCNAAAFARGDVPSWWYMFVLAGTVVYASGGLLPF